jgi:hypothetical protein
MASRFSKEKKQAIRDAISANLNSGNSTIVSLLASQGIVVANSTIRDYRHRYFPKSLRPEYVASAYINQKIKAGKRVTPAELVEKLGIKMNYAYQLARRCNTKIAEKKAGIVPLPKPQVVKKTGIITRTGNVTVHRMF